MTNLTKELPQYIIHHFDVKKRYLHLHKKTNHRYHSCTLNQYLDKHKKLLADIITISTCSKVTKEILSQIPNCKLIITRTIGKDNIDVQACKKFQIKATNIDYPRYVIAHHTWAFILHAVRKLEETFKITKQGIWCKEKIEYPDLRKMKLGILGFGRIGYEVYKIAKAFGIHVLGTCLKYKKRFKYLSKRHFTYVDLETLLKESDIISLHVDLNPTSINLINNNTIKLMKNGVILINTSRGAVINEKDLIKNINKFSYIGLDVLQDETNFNSNNYLLQYPNVFITPHIAYKTLDIELIRWKNTYNKIKQLLM